MTELLATYQPEFRELRENDLAKGLYIAVQHATRIPPHIGFVAAGKYHSLSIKGQDIDVPVDAMLRNIMIRRIPSLFIRIRPHPTFSEEYIGEHFITNVQQFKRVDIGIASCLSPVKLLFEEVYDQDLSRVNFLFELLPCLETAGLLDDYAAIGIEGKTYRFPVYTQKDIDAGILQVRNEFRDLETQR